MKKRIVLSGLLAAALTLSLTACGGDQDAGGDPGAHPIQTSMLVPTPTPTPGACRSQVGGSGLCQDLYLRRRRPRCSPPPSPSR